MVLALLTTENQSSRTKLLLCSCTSRCSFGAGSLRGPERGWLQQEMERLKSNGTLSLPVILGVKPYWVALSKHGHWATVVGGLGTLKDPLG